MVKSRKRGDGMKRSAHLKTSQIKENIVGNAIHKLDVLERNFSKHSPEDNVIQLSHIIKKFFSSFFGVKYKFTYEELSTELTKKKIDEKIKKEVFDLIKQISLLEFSGITPSKKRILSISKEFRELISMIREELLLKEKKEVRKFSISNFSMTGIRNVLRIPQIVGTTHFDKKVKLEPALVREKGRDEANLEEIYKLLLDAHKNLVFNKDVAAEFYRRIMTKYANLSLESKKRIYPEIIEFYKKLVKEG